MSPKRWIFSALCALVLCSGCQSSRSRAKRIDVTYEVASPAELMFGVLIDGEALPGAEVYVWVVIKGPEAYAGKRMRLVLQRGRANSHDDWISGGQEWRPIGTIGEAQADERALAEGVILLRNK